MEKRTTVTLNRFYFKRIEIEVDNSLLKGKTEEEIAEFLTEDFVIENEDQLFEQSELDSLEIDSGGIIYEDTDRFDIYENGKHVYGGHL